MDLMMEDEIHWQGRTISHPADVMCIRDYMQVRDVYGHYSVDGYENKNSAVDYFYLSVLESPG